MVRYPDNNHAKTPAYAIFDTPRFDRVCCVRWDYSLDWRFPFELASRSRICLSFMSSCSSRDCRLGPSPKSNDSMERRV